MRPIAPAQIQALEIENRQNPLGLDIPAPRFSWKIAAEGRGWRQSAWHILVASDPDLLAADEGDVWDSGRIPSEETIGITYAGPPLRSRQRCYWKVRVWDAEGEPTAWSEPAWWEMGLLDRAEWEGTWIGQERPETDPVWRRPAPYLRTGFRLDTPVRQARLYATALGVYLPFLNGRRVSEDRFAPGWTDYRIRVQYQTYEVTDLLRAGDNALGVILGDGWYAGSVGWFGPNLYGRDPRLLLRLEVEHEDGSRTVVTSDNSWSATTGPILASDIMMGEEYDARRAMPGWNEPGFDESGWQPVTAFQMFPGTITAQAGPLVRVMETVRPIAVRPGADGAWIVDLGQNMVGWVRLRARGPRGTEIRLRHAEILTEAGEIYTDNLRKAAQTDHYTLSGGGEEIFAPHFTFHGFRYVEVTGYPGRLTADDVTGCAAYSAMPRTGTFTCSDPMLNRLQEAIVWTQRGNAVEVPTDCPQRDERLGWMGDAQLFSSTAAFNMDLRGFMTKWLQDVLDAQRPSGAFTDVAPHVGTVDAGSAVWADAGVVIPWLLYTVYGDRRILERCYEAMKHWIAFQFDTTDQLIRPYTPYGDWLNVQAPTPKAVVATAYFAHGISIVARAARVLGRDEDAAHYEQLFTGVRAAFNRELVAEGGRIEGDTQTAYILALAVGLLSEEGARIAADRLVADIEAHDRHLTTGIVGTRWLLPVLAEAGRLDVVSDLLRQDTYPSWGYFLQCGATTIWERWDAWLPERGLQNPRMNSFNHWALGSVGDFLYRDLAGLAPDPAAPGYKHVIIRPRPVPGITRAAVTYDSVRGPFRCAWEIRDETFVLDLTLPANTTATVYLPARTGMLISESGRALENTPAITLLTRQDIYTILKIGSGRYHLESLTR